MLNFFFGVLLAGAALVFWMLLRSYQHVPVHEMKRLARAGDDVAGLLYRAAAYGASLRAILGGAAIVCGVFSLLVMVSTLGVVVGMLVTTLLVVVGVFLFIPSGELTRSGLWLSKRAAPVLSWLLERLEPLMGRAIRLVRRYRHVHIHTGLYEPSDLAALLERQRGQADSRITTSEIDLLLHNLSFGDKLVSDAMVPKRVVKTIAATEAVGPVLMDELNRSGHSRFPVYDGKHDHIVGVLFLRKLIGGKKGGTVADIMSRKLTYVHEDFSLYQTLQAFLKTKQHLFLVVNDYEEWVGVVTIEDVLEQMIGRAIVDEFDQYDDLRAVAAAAAKQDHAEHRREKSEPPEPPKKSDRPTPEAKEMVE